MVRADDVAAVEREFALGSRTKELAERAEALADALAKDPNSSDIAAPGLIRFRLMAIATAIRSAAIE